MSLVHDLRPTDAPREHQQILIEDIIMIMMINNNDNDD